MLAVLDTWWGGLKGEAAATERALLLPRLYFQHFTTTSLLVEHGSRPGGVHHRHPSAGRKGK
ncbi:hypothetical protein STRAU_7641 [Streptomyces aurantiacus JA 4570]|uniref:Uncharacterized protein n=1 Tax=Streptomyces aurantiacus JA 4570 TaxID=1286094 RepID=S3Z804_9ACTN|nr:hypothetical protein STRAU_7641 [Streptomyces aurantiacus JA 4570]